MNNLRWSALLACLVAIRLIIGFHFFGEGIEKIRDGNFSAQPFLAAAVGPVAPTAQKWLPDPQGKIRLNVRPAEQPGDGPTYVFDPEITLALWIDFVDRAGQYYGWTVDENTKAKSIFTSYEKQLLDWQREQGGAVLAHFNTADRTIGFERDGVHRERAAQQVKSLRDQVAEIRVDRQRGLMGWISDIENLWDAYELEINAVGSESLAIRQSPPKPPLKIHRPFDQPGHRLYWLNRIVPWFDVTVGVLLIVGLLTPWAAVVGAAFLVSVIATQPPWIPGAAPTQF
ncbi:MAG TPA: DoxX family membrane protein, partial [Pirellulaceae bacterium]|nr:DoxX family membrane protein [Pirellulaceae bacterium]